MTEPTICLNFIATDEPEIIQRMLDSALPYCDYAQLTFSGTGTDTIDIFERRCKEHNVQSRWNVIEWNGHGDARTRGLKDAAGLADYHMVLDCDEELFEFDKILLEHGKEMYLGRLHNKHGQNVSDRLLLLRDDMDWGFVNKHHNTPVSPKVTNNKIDAMVIPAIIHHHEDSASWGDTRTKFLKQVIGLTEQVIENPEDSRSLFYTGMAYLQAGEPEIANAVFKQRLKVPGDPQEAYNCDIRSAVYENDVNRLLGAYQARPTRPDPFYILGQSMMNKKAFHLARVLFVAAIWVGENHECLDTVFYDRSMLEKSKDLFQQCTKMIGEPDAKKLEYREI